MDRRAVHIRLERDLLDELDELANAEHLDRAAYEGAPCSAAVREAPALYGGGEADVESGIAGLREQFRPDRVTWLFVGESSPAGRTHFYRANSNLFRATQEAFAQALGDQVPTGPAFLHDFRDRGCWLVDLADRPVNRLPGRPRKDAVDAGVDALVRLIAEVRPQRIVTVKASITSAVRTAAAAAGFEGTVAELPFPVRQWRSHYVRDLVALLRESESRRQDTLPV